MKLSSVISTLNSMLEQNGDIEVTYTIFTVDDIKGIEHYSSDGSITYPYKDDDLAEEIIEEVEKYMWDSVSDTLWDSIESNAKDVIKRRKDKKERYNQYLALKKEFG